MSIRYSYPIYFSALLLLLAACTQDEPADDARLPEGRYPLQIAAVTLSVEGGEAQPWGAPQTRVSENGDGTGSVWDWNGTEMIGVQLGGETTTYTLNADKTLSTDAPLYWQNTQTATVTAWYPATDGTLDLSDQQTNGLAYLLGGTGTGDYQTDVTLSFTHQLAKVRVTPSDNALGEVQSLQLYTYTQCTYEKGEAGQGSQEGWIEMKKCEYTENSNAITCWEANVVPGYGITKLQANGTEERELSSGITPVAGKFYNITLNYDPGYTEVSEGNYTVNNEKGLKNLAELVNNGATDINITLDTDLTLTGEWTPIGTESRPYTGNFDGGGHTITGLKIDQSGTDYVGLIGRLGSGGKVQDVTLTEVNVTGGTYVGGIAGQTDGTVENCSVNGTVTGQNQTGGIVGRNFSTISGCSAEGTVTGNTNVGGISGLCVPNYDTGTGSLIGSTIEGCHSTAAVSGISSVGGVLGNLGNNSFLMACYSTGNVTATITYGYAHVGGVVGINGQGTVTACYHATGEITSSVGDRIGGIAGCNDQGTFTACYWENNQEQGTGSGSTGGTAKVTDGNWSGAKDAMNTALSGTDWLYVLGSNNLPVLEKNQ